MAARQPPSATYLSGIVAAHVEHAALDTRDVESLIAQAELAPSPRGFARAIRDSAGAGVIAEIKRRSPSKGDLAPDLDPVSLAVDYREGGAACLSVLTDEKFFGGSASDLKQAREASGLPVLRKDFTVCAADVADARLMAADAILLIVAALSEEDLESLIRLVDDLRLDALVEIHDEDELDTALRCGAKVIGVNQRDLHTFDVDTELAIKLASKIPADVLAVAESGITSSDDVERLASSGFDAVLIGETLVTSPDPRSTLRTLAGHRVGARSRNDTIASG
jgi:indole-3-glycerol phosphate synthase